MLIKLILSVLTIITVLLLIIFSCAIVFKIIALIFFLIKEIIEKLLTLFFDYYELVEIEVKPSKNLWRHSYMKYFHFNFFSPILCNDGYLRFGTYYKVWFNGYFYHNTKTIPE